ncbi:zonular occludens toxin Zot [Nitrosomonas ureae]|nr:zonular occludens toxin Zot [Nitrosomonas ureae]
MIIILTATPGCGKTNHAVWSHIKPAVENERIVYVCGIPDLKLMHIKLSIAKLNTWAERRSIDPIDPEGKQKPNNITEGSLIVVDEAAYPWPAIDLKDPPEYIKYLSQYRKHGLDFLVITQSPKFVHPFVLENADWSCPNLTDIFFMESRESRPVKADCSLSRFDFSHSVFSQNCLVISIPVRNACELGCTMTRSR